MNGGTASEIYFVILLLVKKYYVKSYSTLKKTQLVNVDALQSSLSINVVKGSLKLNYIIEDLISCMN